MFEPGALPLRSHLLLVHDRLIPNLVPALDPSFRPDEVFLLVAPAMRREADRLARLLRQERVRVTEWPIDDPWDIDHVRERVLAFLAARDGDGIALNASGGTRPMSLAAYEVFRAADRPVYCVQKGTDQLVWLHPAGRTSFDLADRIRLPVFLAAHDLREAGAVRQGITEPLRVLTETLVNDVERYSASMAKLNWYAASAKRQSLTSKPVRGDDLQLAEFVELLELFSSRDLLQVGADGALRFPDEAARFYANGGWLEGHVFGVLQGMRQELGIRDLARSLRVEWDERKSLIDNEIDVAFLADNRLYLIECKTKRFENNDSPEADVAATLYKLNTLRDYFGGDAANAMLVSYRPLNEKARERAREFGINVCEGEKIQEMERFVQHWIDEPCLKAFAIDFE